MVLIFRNYLIKFRVKITIAEWNGKSMYKNLVMRKLIFLNENLMAWEKYDIYLRNYYDCKLLSISYNTDLPGTEYNGILFLKLIYIFLACPLISKSIFIWNFSILHSNKFEIC